MHLCLKPLVTHHWVNIQLSVNPFTSGDIKYTISNVIMIMNTYTYRERIYYEANDLVKAMHSSVREFSSDIFAFIKLKSMIEVDHYVLAKYKEAEDVWTRTRSCNYIEKRDKLLLVQEWVDLNIKTLNIPPILKLEDNELPRDNKGNTYYIEVRGIRAHKLCFFRAMHIAECFDMPELMGSLKSKDTLYQEGQDYQTFVLDASKNLGFFKEEIYLTYLGLMRAMLSSRSENARRFVDWAMETLFTAHLGTNKQKQKLVTKLTGADYDTVKAFCDVINTKLSVVYMFRIGSVKDLRNQLNIPTEYPDRADVYKYGRTNDIKRRFSEHLRDKYSKRYGFETRLVAAWFVDNKRSPKAEIELEAYLEDKGFRLDSAIHTEIAIFSIKSSEMTRKLDPLFSQYANEMKTLQNLVCKLEASIERIELEKK